MNRHHGPSRPWWSAHAAAAPLVVALLGIASCRPGPDRVTGVDLTVPRTQPLRARCVHDCQAEYAAGVIAEAHRFSAALRACDGRAECLVEQHRAHRRILNALARDRRKCKRGCYNEGAGSSGT